MAKRMLNPSKRLPFTVMEDLNFARGINDPATAASYLLLSARRTEFYAGSARPGSYYAESGHIASAALYAYAAEDMAPISAYKALKALVHAKRQLGDRPDPVPGTVARLHSKNAITVAQVKRQIAIARAAIRSGA